MAAPVSASYLGYTTVSSFLPIPSAIPLTTEYTYPTRCQSRWVQPYPESSGYSDRFYSDSNFGTRFANCAPMGYSAVYYSPGVCPSGWYMATVQEAKTLPDTNDKSNRRWGAVCCGTGYDYETVDGYCTSVFHNTLISAYRAGLLRTLGSYVSSGQTITYTETTSDWDATTNTTALYSGTLLAQPVAIYWESKNLKDFEPRKALALASMFDIPFTPSASPTPNTNELSGLPPLATPSVTARLAAPTSSLILVDAQRSHGAKAGIGVGSFLALVLCIALGFFIYRYRKRKMLGMTGGTPAEIQAAEAPELIEVRKTAHRVVMTANVVAA